jgi:hypothetical protein
MAFVAYPMKSPEIPEDTGETAEDLRTIRLMKMFVMATTQRRLRS